MQLLESNHRLSTATYLSQINSSTNALPTSFLAKLQPHQQEALTCLGKTRTNGSTTAQIIMASGTGKTIVAMADITQFLQEYGYTKILPKQENNPVTLHPRVLVICHAGQLLLQHIREFQKVFDDKYSYGLFSSLQHTIGKPDFLFATFQSLAKYIDWFQPDDFDYIWIDEAHHVPAKSFSKVADFFTPKFMLGVTATPIREDGASLEEKFGKPTYELDLVKAWEYDLLAPVSCKVFTDYIEGIEAYLDNGEKVSWQQLNQRVFVEQRDEKIIAKVSEFLQSDATTVYLCRSIAHAEKIAKLIPEAQAIHSKLSEKELERRLTAFRQGTLHTITTVDVLNEGIDIPRIDNLIFLRPTRSLRILLQELGRGLRKAPDKDRVMVYDFVGNCDHLEMLFNLERKFKPQQNASTGKPTKQAMFELSIETPKFQERKLDLMNLLTNIRQHGQQYGKRRSNDQLLEDLRQKAIRDGKIPTVADVDNDPLMVRSSTYTLRFKTGWKNIIEMSGAPAALRKTGSKSIIAIKYQMTQALRNWAKELGHTPHDYDFAHRPKQIANKAKYIKLFGGYNKACIAAGIPTRKKYTAEELILIMQNEVEVERDYIVPSLKEWKKIPFTPGSKTIAKLFGNYTKFIIAAGYNPPDYNSYYQANCVEIMRSKEETQ